MILGTQIDATIRKLQKKRNNQKSKKNGIGLDIARSTTCFRLDIDKGPFVSSLSQEGGRSWLMQGTLTTLIFKSRSAFYWNRASYHSLILSTCYYTNQWFSKYSHGSLFETPSGPPKGEVKIIVIMTIYIYTFFFWSFSQCRHSALMMSKTVSTLSQIKAVAPNRTHIHCVFYHHTFPVDHTNTKTGSLENALDEAITIINLIKSLLS